MGNSGHNFCNLFFVRDLKNYNLSEINEFKHTKTLSALFIHSGLSLSPSLNPSLSFLPFLTHTHTQNLIYIYIPRKGKTQCTQLGSNASLLCSLGLTQSVSIVCNICLFFGNFLVNYTSIFGWFFKNRMQNQKNIPF